MGVINDKNVIDAVQSMGTATSSMIYDWLYNHMPLDRKTVIRIACKKIKNLAKYHILEVQVYCDKLWYYLPDDGPADHPVEPPKCGADRLRQHIDSMSPGESISITEAMRISGKGKRQVYNVLTKHPLMLHKKRSTAFQRVRV